MNNIKRYNIFILISTFARNIVTVFSPVILYKMGYSLKEIFIFLAILYFNGGLISILFLYYSNKIKIKYLLVIANLFLGFSFYYLSIMSKSPINLYFLAFIYSLGIYGYHSIRHYLAINYLTNNKRNNIGSIIIYTNIAVIISSLLSGYIATSFSIIALSFIIFIISLVSIIPISNFNIKESNKKINLPKLEKRKFLFFVLEQSKGLFLLLEPLFIYLFIARSIKYVMISSSIIGFAACIFTYFFVRKIDDKKYFKYLNIIFCIILLLKLNISNEYLMLLIIFLEGLFIKVYDVVSMENLYVIPNNIDIRGYLIICEIIFCLVSSLMCFSFIFLDNLKIILYILIVLIFISSFVKRN